MNVPPPPVRSGQKVVDTQVGGHLLQIQDVAGNVTVHTGPVVRSAYLEQVKQIVPADLRDRDDELAKLAAFCTEPGRGPYLWLQAPAWAGKSALMSWFVLHPPPGVRVLSFFVTARYAGQSDWLAFTEVMLEQLADELGQPMPAYLTETTRPAHLLRMLGEAAEACQRRGQRLVLVIDGLDEDRGVTVDPDAHSIAALLPGVPGAGLRIITSGRPDPPVPADVPDGHPLRDPETIRVLGSSRWAKVVRSDLQRELKRLLRGDQAEQDLLGLVTAAGGGLSGPALAELSGMPEYDVEENLHAVAGRTFATRSGSWMPGTTVYVLGHEELQLAAARSLGETRLAGYRRRLHAWAEDYRQRGWPSGTPEYLFVGYYRMLQATANLPEIISCAIDQARHDRMLDVTGGDTAALAEITGAQNALLSSEEPDLEAMARLAVCRDRIGARNACIPSGLPAVWAAIGHPARAEALARAIRDPHHRAASLASLARTVALAGDREKGRALAELAERMTGSIAEPGEREAALVTMVWAVAPFDLDWAEALARTITHPSRQVDSLIFIARMADPADGLVRAEALARTIANPYWRLRAMGSLAEAAASAGDPDRARAYSQEANTAFIKAFTVAKGLPFAEGLPLMAETMAILLRATAAAGDRDRARTLTGQAEEIIRPTAEVIRAETLQSFAEAVAFSGDLDRAEAFASMITSPGGQVKALASLAEAAAGAGDQGRAQALVQRAREVNFPPAELKRQKVISAEGPAGEQTFAQRLARAVRATPHHAPTGPDSDEQAALVQAAAAAGDLERAEADARAITSPRAQTHALFGLAKTIADGGDLRRAETLARIIVLSDWQAIALTAVAEAAASAGNLGKAEILAQSAEQIARTAIDSDPRAEGKGALRVLSKAAADSGLVDQAQVLARAIPDPDEQIKALETVARAAAAAGDLDRARLIAGETEQIARSVMNTRDQDSVRRVLVRVMTVAGNLERATLLANAIAEPDDQANMLAYIAEAAVAAGELDRARVIAEDVERIAAAISDPARQERARDAAVRAVTAVGDLEWAEVLASGLSSSGQRARLASLVEAAVDAGDLEKAEILAEAIAEPVAMTKAFLSLAKAAADTGNADHGRALAQRAEAAAQTITDPKKQARERVQTLIAVGDLDQAQAVARTITDPGWRGIALEFIIRAVGRADPERVRMLAREAEAAARDVRVSIPGDSYAVDLTDLALAMAAAGDLEGAEALVGTIAEPSRQAYALASLAAEAEPHRSRSLIARALTVGHWINVLSALAQTQPSVLLTVIKEYAKADGSGLQVP